MFPSLSIPVLAVTAIVLASGIGGAYLVADRSGYARCERDVSRSNALAQAAENQRYREAIERADSISEELAKTQRTLNATKIEYLAYANGIGGNCPEPLRVLAHYAARNEPVPETPSPPTDAAPTFSASDIAKNIAENYARCHANAAQLDALIKYHKEPLNE
jgi:hypothetical protein